MACPDFEVTFSCPFCDDAEITATFEPGSSGSRDEPPYSEQLIDLEGCPHALAYIERRLTTPDERQMDDAIDAACEDAARDALDDADASREAAWERRREEC